MSVVITYFVILCNSFMRSLFESLINYAMINQPDFKAPKATIIKLESTSQIEMCAEILSNSEPWITLRMTRKYIKNFLIDPVSESYVQMVNNEVSGVVIIQMQGPFPGYIKVIAIAPNWRGKGYGRQLLEFSEERIYRDYPNVFLCVSSFNHNAQDFYRKMGYDQVGVLKDYLIEGQSENILRKTRGPVMGY